MNSQTNAFDYDVALSFAGEDRAIALAIAEGLTSRKIRVFYDEFEESRLWGKNLYDHLADVYFKRAAFCLIIISSSYARKAWATHERQHAQARAFSEKREYILPLRLDDTQLPGIAPTIAYVDYRKSSIEKIVDLLTQKLSAARFGVVEGEKEGKGLDEPLLKLNLSAVGLKIVAEKKDGWECGLFIEILGEEIESCRGLKLDLQYGVVSGQARRFAVSEFFGWFSEHVELLMRQEEAFTRLSQEGLRVVLGPEECEGDPVSICLIARKIGSLYRWAAEWGVGFRSIIVNDNFSKLLGLCGEAAFGLMEGIEGLHGAIKASFDYWCGLDEKSKAEYQPQVVVPLPSRNVGGIMSEMERLRKIYKR